GDGKTDIIRAARTTSSCDISVQLSQGTSYDTARSWGTVGPLPSCQFQDDNNSMASIVVADANGDGKMDLFVSPSGAGQIYLSTGAGLGSAISADYDPGNAIYTLADVNGDGKMDIVKAVPGSPSGCNTTVQLAKEGSFAAATSWALNIGAVNCTFRSYYDSIWQQYRSAGIAVADANGDGKA